MTTLVRSVFSRALGGVYVVAFDSLRRQVLGLYGSRGLAPIGDYLEIVDRVARGDRRRRWRLAPTVFWRDASDRALVRACAAGEACGALLVLGVAPRLASIGAWGLYLSFASVGRELLSFQWDALLLETGLAAIVVAPSRRRERTPWPAVAMMRALAVRLYFESGLCKLASRDPTWRSCTACCYHYETQPLPTLIGWYAHHLPRRFHRLATLLVLAIELGAPVLALGPRPIRRVAVGALAALQALIALTGNYGFFNLLAVADMLWLLDDRALARALRVRRPRPRRAPWWRRLVTTCATLPLLALSVVDLASRIARRPVGPRVLDKLDGALAPLRAVSSYGLFSVMTTERPEIVIEGSLDGEHWREYELPYKPGDVKRAPRRAAPHQPRLDWQLWFAALQGVPPPWFARLMTRLLDGAPEVLALFARDPFPDGPPVYVRALLYDYRMTDLATRRRTGAWWRRELRGSYFPAVRRAG